MPLNFHLKTKAVEIFFFPIQAKFTASVEPPFTLINKLYCPNLRYIIGIRRIPDFDIRSMKEHKMSC